MISRLGAAVRKRPSVLVSHKKKSDRFAKTGSGWTESKLRQRWRCLWDRRQQRQHLGAHADGVLSSRLQDMRAGGKGQVDDVQV